LRIIKAKITNENRNDKTTLNKPIKYITTAVFLFAILNLVDFTQLFSNTSVPRYQFHDLPFGAAIRKIADFLLIYLLISLTLRLWRNSVTDKQFLIYSLLFIALILIDIHIWLWRFRSIDIFFIVTFSIPVLILLIHLPRIRQLKFSYCIFFGLAVIMIALLLDKFLVEDVYENMTEEQFDRNTAFEKIRSLFYYFGIMSILAGLITALSQQANRNH
jgi:hypothetical protein